MILKIVTNGRLKGTKYYIFNFIDEDEFRRDLSVLKKTAKAVFSDEENKSKRKAAFEVFLELEKHVGTKSDDEEYKVYSVLFEEEMCTFAECVFYMMSVLQSTSYENQTEKNDEDNMSDEKEKRLHSNINMTAVMDDYYENILGMNMDTKEEAREKRIAENKAKHRPEHSGVEWSEEEDEQLEREFKEGMKTWKIGQIHKRSAYAIWRRLKIHGLV